MTGIITIGNTNFVIESLLWFDGETVHRVITIYYSFDEGAQSCEIKYSFGMLIQYVKEEID